MCFLVGFGWRRAARSRAAATATSRSERVSAPVFMRPLVASEFEEVFRLRLQMEPTAVALGAKLATDADRQTARQALDTLNAGVRDGNG